MPETLTLTTEKVKSTIQNISTFVKKVENNKQFLENYGFKNTKNNDYFNTNLGIILEDLHDENVLTANDILYFIDTVFYIKRDTMIIHLLQK
jgi:hypothetical protein